MQRDGKLNQRKFLRIARILPARGRGQAARDSELTPDGQIPADLLGAIGDILSGVPVSKASEVADANAAAERLAHAAAHRAALLSGSLALPPGPLGMLTLLPDLYLIWKLQRQMVADIFALHGRTAELTRSSMIYCLFRHLASHVARDVAVRGAERAVLGAVTSSAVQGTATALGMHITRRIAGTTASRWIPVAGAAAVGAYAYWDTLQVAKATRRLLAGVDVPPALLDVDAEALRS